MDSHRIEQFTKSILAEDEKKCDFCGAFVTISRAPKKWHSNTYKARNAFCIHNLITCRNTPLEKRDFPSLLFLGRTFFCQFGCRFKTRDRLTLFKHLHECHSAEELEILAEKDNLSHNRHLQLTSQHNNSKGGF